MRCEWRGRNIGTPTSWRLRLSLQIPTIRTLQVRATGLRILITSKKNDALRTCCFRQFSSHIASLLAFASTSPQSTFVFACEARKQASKRKRTKHQPRAFRKNSAISTYLMRYSRLYKYLRGDVRAQGRHTEYGHSCVKNRRFQADCTPANNRTPTAQRRQPKPRNQARCSRAPSPPGISDLSTTLRSILLLLNPS